MKRKKIVVDTNLWISFLISKNPAPIEFLLLSKRFQILFSKSLSEELSAVSHRKRFRNYFPVNDIRKLTNLLSEHSTFIEIISNLQSSRDEKDNFLLNLAVDGQTD